jgi:hypothetical protein
MNHLLPFQDRGIILSVFPYDFDFTPSISLLDLTPAKDPSERPAASRFKSSKIEVEKKKRRKKKKEQG